MSTQPQGRIVPAFTAGDRLKKAREHAGMDQGELAEATGISRSTVSHLELDKTPLRRSYAQLWSMATGISCEWLETGHGAVDPSKPGLDPRPADALAQLAARKRARHAGSGDTHRYAA